MDIWLTQHRFYSELRAIKHKCVPEEPTSYNRVHTAESHWEGFKNWAIKTRATGFKTTKGKWSC